jgi:pimeloyl-ACP methyl ester carboxylesterase
MLKRIFLQAFLLVTSSSALAVQPLTPSRYISVNGLNVAVYESAGTQTPAVLLIHGNTSSANAFAKIMNSAFARHQRVVTVDLPGYGHSDNAPAYNIAFFAQVIQQVAQATQTDNGVIVGWSLGGDLALQSVSLLPQVKGYFLIGTAPVGNTPDLPPPFLSAQESYAGAAVNYGFIPTLTTQQIDDYVTAFFRPGYPQIPQFLYQDGQRTDPGTRAAVLAVLQGQDPTFQDEVVVASHLTVPLALVVGEKEAFVRQAFLDALAPQLPTLWRGKTIVIKNTGHAVQYERPQRTINLLKKFIDQL